MDGTRSIHAQAQDFRQSKQPDRTESQKEVRGPIPKICYKFPLGDWRHKYKAHEFPHELTIELVKAGWLGICMPTEYGGSELGVACHDANNLRVGCRTGRRLLRPYEHLRP